MISKETLDKETQKVLQKILGKNPGELSPDEIAILWARQAYLTEAEIKNIPKIEEAEIVKDIPKAIKWKPKKK